MQITTEEIKKLMAENAAKAAKRKKEIESILEKNQADNDKLVNELAKRFGFDLTQEGKEKTYPEFDHSFEANSHIFSDKFKTRDLLLKYFPSFKLPKESTLIIGTNGLGKSPLMRYWHECIKNKTKDILKQERINFENGMQFWQLDKEKRKFNSRYLTELEIYEKFVEEKRAPDFNSMTGYLFLDDILQDAIWNDEKNFNHKPLIVAFTRLYENLRDDYSGGLIVIASTNHMPLKESMGDDTRIQSRIVGLFKNRVEIK
jgi:ATPase subunit of ABC transporter with duplicated ATPase domains